jgi:dTDP-4-dehydrorhamnose reductase
MTTPGSPGRVWVTGAAGLIGRYLVQAAPLLAPGWQVRGLTRVELELTDFDAVGRAFQEERPALVIHCAAMSRSPSCQADPARARLVNVETTRVLADLSAHSRLVFFSTDLVFDGKRGHYREEAAPNPTGVYAETKLEAEQAVLRHGHHLVIRTSLNGGTSGSGDRSFNEELRRAWRAGRTLRLFTDEFRSPIHASVTARAVWELALAGATGLYHVAGSQRLSRYEIGQRVAARCPELKPGIEAASLTEYSGAPRPPDTSLDCAKAQQRLTFRLPGLSEWLDDHPDLLF